MKEYHYIDAAGQQCGPYALHDLKAYPIAKTTLVWTTGMADWVEAQTVNELNFLFDTSAQQTHSTASSQPTQQANQSYQQAGQRNDKNERQSGILDGSVPMPKNWLVESILVTLCCCPPFGIAGIVNASKVETLYRFGDYEEAMRVSREAKKWFIVGLVLGILGGTMYAVYMIAMVGMATSSFY